MCVNPRLLPIGVKTPCHKCWQCRENRINDWVGRCIAEKETSVATVSVTLTYGGGDVPQSRFLRKSDVTAYLKAIRNDGHKVRYFVTGEYGSKKGRSHWHAVLFFQTPMPHRELRQNITCKWWPHGWAFYDDANSSSIRYVMKYINKDNADPDAIKNLAMSRKPILGYEYFAGLADRYIDQGLSPLRPFYKFRDVLDKHGRPLEFYMPPLVQERFAELYINRWRHRHGKKHWPTSELLDKYEDKMAGYIPLLSLSPPRMRGAPWMLPPDGSKPCFDEGMNSFYADINGQRLWWSFDERGQRAWLDVVVTEKQAEALADRWAASEGRKLYA